MSEVVRDSLVVKADPDTVMDVIADFESYREWQDGIREVEVLEVDDDGWGTRVRFVVDARATSAELVLAYTYTDDEMRWRLLESPQLRRNDGAYRLEDLGDGTTRVTYELEIDPVLPVPGPLRRQLAKRIIGGALHDMKRRVELGA